MAKKKMKKGLKIFIIILVLAFVVAGVLISLRFFLNRDKSVQNTYTVNKEIYENVIEISGTVSAAEQQTLNALGDGTVMGVFVKKGDTVKKATSLFSLMILIRFIILKSMITRWQKQSLQVRPAT